MAKKAEIELAKELMELFFHAPAANGILVFEDQDYLGVLFKRDIEIGMSEGNFRLFENINLIKVSQLDEVLFKNGSSRNGKIPVVDKAGQLIRIISQEEFLCHFFFDEYLQHFKTQSVLDHLEHAVIITSYFKKIIYANKKALELIQNDIIGKSFSSVLKLFEIKSADSFMELEKDGRFYRLSISASVSKSFSYFVYQFLKF
jgi:hypothetical protein